MKPILITLSTTLLTAGVAMAECAKPEDTLFSCVENDLYQPHSIEVCMIEGDPYPKISYKYGEKTKNTELELTLDFLNPAGNEINAPSSEGYVANDNYGGTVEIIRGNFKYSLVQGFPFQPPGHDPINAHILFVTENGKDIGGMNCDESTHHGDLNILIDRLKKSGVDTVYQGG